MFDVNYIRFIVVCSMTKKRSVWQKNLYENYGYEDNYTDSSFLRELRTNVNVQFYTFKEALYGATALNNQVSCIIAFLISFYLLYSERCTPTSVLLPTSLATILGYVCYHVRRHQTPAHLVEDSKTVVAVLLFGYLFAPLLHKLTDAISTDTIFTMTMFVMILNLVFFDYGLSSAEVTSNAISLNAAIFGSICLASRLSSSYHAFVLLVDATIFFVLYPRLVTTFWRPYFIVPIFVGCCFCLFHISSTLLCIYVLISVFINIICPWTFVRLQKHKNNIHGPWDEAIVIEETNDTHIHE